MTNPNGTGVEFLRQPSTTMSRWCRRSPAIGWRPTPWGVLRRNANHCRCQLSICLAPDPLLSFNKIFNPTEYLRHNTAMNPRKQQKTTSTPSSAAPCVRDDGEGAWIHLTILEAVNISISYKICRFFNSKPHSNSLFHCPFKYSNSSLPCSSSLPPSPPLLLPPLLPLHLPG